MSSFRTPVKIPPASVQLSYTDPLLCIGSCFAVHLSSRLSDYKLPVMANPFGILYNPVSLVDCLRYLRTEALFSEKDIFEQQGRWHSFRHHGHFSQGTAQQTLQGINTALTSARTFANKTTRLLLTLGTAHAWVDKTSGEIVANCHKLPASRFERRRLLVGEIVEALSNELAHWPEVEVIITVSPVRHLRDGAVENQRSKASLLLAAAELETKQSNVYYFPAYELLQDELRDYRFYAADMIHPSEVAVNYIWEQFEAVCLTAKTQTIIREIQPLLRAIQHRPFDVSSPAHQQFLQKQLTKSKHLQQKYPFLDLEKEINFFEVFLENL